MSPRRDSFIDFRRIEPKGVKAANKTVFMATGIGRMKINVPNGKDTTLRLSRYKMCFTAQT